MNQSINQPSKFQSLECILAEWNLLQRIRDLTVSEMPREINLEAIQPGTTQTLSKHNCFPEIVVIENPLPICNIYHKTNLWLLIPKYTHYPIFKSKSTTLAKTMWSCLCLIDCNVTIHHTNEISVESLTSQEKCRSIVYVPHIHTTYHYLPQPLLGDFFFSVHSSVTILVWYPLVSILSYI